MKPVARKPAAVRKREIAEAAMSICGTHGVAALTTATIAEAIGLSTGAIFRHFGTLEDVLHEAADLAIQKMDATFPDAELPAIERLFDLAQARIELLGNDAGLAWMLTSDEARLRLPKDAAAALMTLVDRSKRFLLKAIADGQRDGTIRDDIGSSVLFVCVMGTIHTLIGMSGIRGKNKKTTRNVKTRSVLDGLRLMLTNQTG